MLRMSGVWVRRILRPIGTSGCRPSVTFFLDAYQQVEREGWNLLAILLEGSTASANALTVKSATGRCSIISARAFSASFATSSETVASRSGGELPATVISVASCLPV